MVRIPSKLATSEEIKEAKYVGVPRIRLQYLKNSKRMMGIPLWNLVEPKLPGYTYDGGLPTFSLAGLRERGVL
jgi:hypothetical protein